MSAGSLAEETIDRNGVPEEKASGSKGKKENKWKKIRLLKMPLSVQQGKTDDHNTYAQILNPHLAHFRQSIDKMVTLTQEKIATQSSEIQYRKMLLSDTVRDRLRRSSIQRVPIKLLPRESPAIPPGLWTEDTGVAAELLDDDTLSHPFDDLMLVVMDDDSEDDQP